MNYSRTTRPVLWIMAASARWLATSLQRSGKFTKLFDMVAVDRFGDADLVQSVRHIHCANWEQTLKDLPIQSQDLVVFGGGLENHGGLLAIAARQARVLGFPIYELARTKTPEIWCPLVRKAGFSVPNWISNCNGKITLNPTSDDLFPGEPAVALNINPTVNLQPVNLFGAQHWIAKPRQSAGGHQIEWHPVLNNPSKQLSTLEPQRFLQQFVPGPSWSASYLATDRSCHFIGACRQIIGGVHMSARPFQYQGAWGLIRLTLSQQQRLQEFGQFIREQFSARGLFGIDLVGSPDGDWSVIEINPRPTSSMELLELAASPGDRPISLIDLHISACLEEEITESFPISDCHLNFAKQIIFHNDDRSLRIDESLSNWLWSWAEKSQAADLPALGSEIFPGQPVCTIFDSGEFRCHALASLDKKIQLWHALTSKTKV